MKTTKNRGHFGQPCCSFVHEYQLLQCYHPGALQNGWV